MGIAQVRCEVVGRLLQGSRGMPEACGNLVNRDVKQPRERYLVCFGAVVDQLLDGALGKPCNGNICQQRTESDGQEQQGFEFPDNGQVDEAATDDHHQQLTPGIACGELGKPHGLPERAESFHQARVTSVSPTCTASPSLTLTEATVPAQEALTSVSIFMASRITTTSPSLTVWPSTTLIL